MVLGEGGVPENTTVSSFDLKISVEKETPSHLHSTGHVESKVVFVFVLVRVSPSRSHFFGSFPFERRGPDRRKSPWVEVRSTRVNLSGVHPIIKPKFRV